MPKSQYIGWQWAAWLANVLLLACPSFAGAQKTQSGLDEPQKPIELMPPIAPRLDLGSQTPTVAPDFVRRSVRRANGQAQPKVLGNEQPAPPCAPSFRSPLLTREGDSTVLHGSASEFSSRQAAEGYFSNPLAAGAAAQPPFCSSANQTSSPAYYGAVDQRQQQAVLQSQKLSADSAAAAGNTAANGTGSRFRGVAGIGLHAAMSAAGTGLGGPAASVFGALHCPLCRLLDGL